MKGGLPGIDKAVIAARHNGPRQQGKVSMSQSGLEKIIDDAFKPQLEAAIKEFKGGFKS